MTLETDAATDVEGVAEALSQAIVEGDEVALRAIYTEDALIWHNTDGAEQSLDEVIAGIRAMQRLDSIEIDVRRRSVIPDGFLQTQRWTFTTAAQEKIELETAFVVTLNADLRITRLDEYVDSAALAPLGAALA